MNLAHVLQAVARERPDSAAIVESVRGRSVVTTFAELEQCSCRAAALLRSLGLRAGDTVLVFQPMSAELYVVLLTLFRLGLVAMFLDPSAGREHIERCCALHAPRAFVGSTKAHLLRLFCPALRRIPVKLVIGWPLPGATRWSRATRHAPFADIHDCSADTPTLITFTSGSTGQPKAAIRTHGLLLAQHRALAASLHLTPGDRDLATLPIVALANLGAGVTTVIPDADLRYPGKVAPAPIVQQMLTERVVSSVASPAFFEQLTRHCHTQGLTLPDVRKLYTGGAPVFPRLLDQMQAMAPHADIVALYGSTEAEPIAHVSRTEISAEDHQAMLAGRGLIAGVPVTEINLRVLRDCWGTPIAPLNHTSFAERCCRPNEPGEIVVSGEHVLQGYLHGRGDEETKFRVEGTVWHRTGDAGYVDDRGRLWLLGRCSARLHDERGVLYPFAVETAAYQDANVKRAALASHRGKRILAIEYFDVSARAEPASLHWAGLDEIRTCRSIPVDKRHNAKIDYPALYKLLERGGS